MGYPAKVQLVLRENKPRLATNSSTLPWSLSGAVDHADTG